MPTTEEPTKVDVAASDACVRSGTFALLLSVALLLLVPSWLVQPNYAALRRYLGDRIALANLVDALDDNPFWVKYEASNPAAASMSIKDLLGVSVVASSTNSKISAPKRIPAAPARQGQKQAGVAPVTMLGATVMLPLDQIQPIADTLGRLNDSNVLTRSRHVSNFFRFSIARWIDKRNRLAYRNQMMNDRFTEQLVLPNQVETSTDFVPALRNEEMLKNLTFRDVEELAHMEVPAFLGPPQLGDQVSPPIDVPLGSSLPHDLYAASLLAQLLLFFMLVHFGAFVREAVSSPKFPAPGTLFSAFSRSRSGLVIFAFATFIPPLTSTLVLCASWTSQSMFRIVSLLVCTVLILWGFFSVQIVLWRTRYFNSLIDRDNTRGDAKTALKG